MATNEKTPAEQLIEDDQGRGHAVFCVDCSVKDELKLEDEIENGLMGLRDRAAAARMQMIAAPAILQSAYYDEGDGCGHVVITVICGWVSESALEKMRLQDKLVGGGDPRFTGGKR